VAKHLLREPSNPPIGGFFIARKPVTPRHKVGNIESIGVHALVYFEMHSDIAEVIRREKQLKKWKRSWKIELIEKTNSEWKDLWQGILWGGQESGNGLAGYSAVIPRKRASRSARHFHKKGDPEPLVIPAKGMTGKGRAIR
jgi:hypothetical protein